MPELMPAEHLQPSLLDRLTDDAPASPRESREQRFFDVRRLRASVLRDLAWLLNATNGNGGPDVADHPLVARSTINFGIPGSGVHLIHAGSQLLVNNGTAGITIDEVTGGAARITVWMGRPGSMASVNPGVEYQAFRLGISHDNVNNCYGCGRQV